MAEKVVIIGSGPAGWTAALYTARAELKPVVIEGREPGGQLMGTTDVENFPGFPEGILGPELMEVFKKQAVRFGARIISDNVDSVDFSVHPFKLTTSKNGVVEAESVIIATGASSKWLNVPGEAKLKGHGVSGCATCDGFFFKEKMIAVVGGGDAAMEEANFLTKFAKSVTVIVRGDALRASKIMQERTMKNPKISFLWNAEVREVLGDEKISGLKIFNNKTNEMTEMPIEGLFVAIGHEPNTAIFKDKLELDVKNYIVVRSGSTKTKIEGVFASGDVADHVYRQAVTAAGTGCMAALDAERYLSSKE